MAGLWECWHRRSPPEQGQTDAAKPEDARAEEIVISCTILTTAANDDMRPLHDRMPVILQSDQYDTWLSDQSSPKQRLNLMQPLDNGLLHRFRVSTVVNKPGNDTAECVQPIE